MHSSQEMIFFTRLSPLRLSQQAPGTTVESIHSVYIHMDLQKAFVEVCHVVKLKEPCTAILDEATHT